MNNEKIFINNFYFKLFKKIMKIKQIFFIVQETFSSNKKIIFSYPERP